MMTATPDGVMAGGARRSRMRTGRKGMVHKGGRPVVAIHDDNLGRRGESEHEHDPERGRSRPARAEDERACNCLERQRKGAKGAGKKTQHVLRHDGASTLDGAATIAPDCLHK